MILIVYPLFFAFTINSMKNTEELSAVMFLKSGINLFWPFISFYCPLSNYCLAPYGNGMRTYDKFVKSCSKIISLFYSYHSCHTMHKAKSVLPVYPCKPICSYEWSCRHEAVVYDFFPLVDQIFLPLLVDNAVGIPNISTLIVI